MSGRTKSQAKNSKRTTNKQLKPNLCDYTSLEDVTVQDISINLVLESKPKSTRKQVSKPKPEQVEPSPKQVTVDNSKLIRSIMRTESKQDHKPEDLLETMNNKAIQKVKPTAHKSKRAPSVKNSRLTTKFDVTALTDENPICPGVHVNPIMEIYMRQMISEHKDANNLADEKFRDNRLSFVNSNIKTDNKYILDKYNLVIKRNEFNKTKTAFGWVYDADGDPINIHINPNLLETKSNDITFVTLQQLKQKYPTLFQARGVMYKVYTHETGIGIDVKML